ncbi:MAG: peptidoglycan editing factor PgeF [Clostridia bacterium]|nr:peptidoglycan editing factor PgeF [Clostridia bacterium]
MEYRKENRLYLKSELIEKCDGVNHCFTSRLGGVSCGKISGLNLGFRVDDNPKSVKENYRIVADDMNFNLDNMVLAKQTHTDNIRIVTREDAGKGIAKVSDIEDTDGLLTKEKGIALVVFAADCVPVLLYDPQREVAGAIHAGWRGTVKGITGKAVTMMEKEYGSKPEGIVVTIGPSIGPCCFEFGNDAKNYFPEKYIKRISDEKCLIDIWSMNKDQLLSQGVLEKNIDLLGVCTVCNSDKFYSYRTHKEHTGRQTAIIEIKK